ncbi:hypothetical protein [Cesiribacter sp. SM1]|uniref:hypothetical protein n=1 Tax=Cesiribacter sp. SM1 TaxID=2861196 RepID=UPI001CD2513D|nr:hypothetical protein [Cesiribacter sp. SM1]
MKTLPSFIIILLIGSLLISCKPERDAVIPSNVLRSDRGLVIELEWNTGGSSSQALYDSDLDLYLDQNEIPIEASENINSFEAVYLRDVYKDGYYDILIGAIDVRRHTDYKLFISAPGGEIIHQYHGYFLAGENGEVPYLRIRKQGRTYTLIDL